MDDEELCEQVADELRDVGMNAFSWDSGGGIIGVGIGPGAAPPDELRFFFGTADVVWAGEVFDGEDAVGDVSTELSSDSDDPREIASAIMHSVADFIQFNRAARSPATMASEEDR